jgi:thioredoxin-like negative regulator of GroEL
MTRRPRPAGVHAQGLNPVALSSRARAAAQDRDWRTVQTCAAGILRQGPNDAEGHFLAGLAARGLNRPAEAVAAFRRALELDDRRYDAAIELAALLLASGRHLDALKLVEANEDRLGDSPMYLDLAGTLYSRMALHERAAPLYERAVRLQPDAEPLLGNLAACRVFMGRIEEAAEIYESLLARFPRHQRYHYELSKLRRARDSVHVEQMQGVLEASRLPPPRNIFLYYAIGKELEDLERWDEAFRYYELAGDAAKSVSPYDVRTDVELIDRIIEVCDADWLADAPGSAPDAAAATPIFIVGLPRTGTTLADRILSSHSQVESAGESFFMQNAVQFHSGLPPGGLMTAEVVAAAARKPIGDIGCSYLEWIGYRLSGKPMFVEKFPENFLYLGFIAKAFPRARIVHLHRHPMDACFAMYKQSFFRYAFTLQDLGSFYVGYHRLVRHWRALLGERLVELHYESLVADQEGETRRLLERLGLEFEPACLEFDRNRAAVYTASAVQVREPIHARSVRKWEHFSRHLQPLREHLGAAGIVVD